MIYLAIPYRPNFSETEDALLLIGLKKFGRNNVRSIRAYCLPGKSTRTISARIKNRLYIQSKPNEIRNYLLMPFKPMNECERQVLYWGVKEFGRHFKSIAQKVFNYMPDYLIRSVWDELYSQVN